VDVGEGQLASGVQSCNTGAAKGSLVVLVAGRENALGEFIRHQLHPLGEHGELSRHLRIFNWEAVRPTAVYRKLMSEEAAPVMALAVDLVRRFLPKADQSTLIMAAVWLVGQCAIFVRNREQLTHLSHWRWTAPLSNGLHSSSVPGRSRA
jgi:hypothetical protein